MAEGDLDGTPAAGTMTFTVSLSNPSAYLAIIMKAVTLGQQGSLVDAAVELGARLAEPGEFTQRAFLNDKLDLAQAEAIADLIASGTEQAARAALHSLSGVFSSAVDALAEQLVRLRMHVEAAIDFPEEEIDFLADEELGERLGACSAAFDSLLSKAAVGRVMRDGEQVVIVERPGRLQPITTHRHLAQERGQPGDLLEYVDEETGAGHDAGDARTKPTK